ASSFTPTNLVATIPGTSWQIGARVDAPTEAPTADYLSFSLSLPTGNHGAFNWQAGQEVLVFSFQNSGSCAGPVSLMADNDPFNTLPNSANTSPGNQIDVIGLGSDPGNDYLDIYGTAADCSALTPGIEYKIVYNSTTNRYEVYLRPTVTPG